MKKYITIGMLFSAAILLMFCKKDDGPAPDLPFQIFPSLNAPGRPILISSSKSLGSGTRVEIDGIALSIDTIVPTRDSLIVTIPANQSTGQAEIELRAEQGASQLDYEIVSNSYFDNLPAGSPIFIFPGGSNFSPVIISNDAPQTIEVVNLNDPTHRMSLPIGDFQPDRNKDCQNSDPLQVVLCRCDVFYEKLNKGFNCLEIVWDSEKGACNLPDARIESLIIQRASDKSDEYSGVFFTSNSIEVSKDVLKVTNDDFKYGEDFVFLLLSSKTDGFQYIFLVYEGTFDPIELFCN